MSTELLILPPAVPEGQYRLNVQIVDGTNNTVLKAIIYAVVKAKGANILKV